MNNNVMPQVYLTYKEQALNIDYKDYTIYLGKKIRSYKLWYSIAMTGLEDFRQLLSDKFDSAHQLVTMLDDKGIYAEAIYGTVRVVGDYYDKLKDNGFLVDKSEDGVIIDLKTARALFPKTRLVDPAPQQRQGQRQA